MTDPANPDHWFLLAKDRLEKADAVYAQFGASWTGVELLQEAAERYLKGYLVSRGWTLVKTHDLSRLLAAACERVVLELRHPVPDFDRAVLGAALSWRRSRRGWRRLL